MIGLKSRTIKEKFTDGWFSVVIVIAGWIAVLATWTWVSRNAPSSLVRLLIFIILSIAIVYCDNSNIRTTFMHRYPKKYPFAAKLKRKPKREDLAAEYYKTACYFFTLMTWFVPRFRFVFTGLTILFVILSIARYIRHSDSIHLGTKDQKELSSTSKAILVPSVLLALWGLSNQTYNRTLWILLAVLSLVFILPFFIFSAEYKKKISVAFGFIFCAAIFVFGALCTINTDYDFSRPKEYPVTVVDKHISGGKSRTLYVTVTPWSDHKENEDIEVDTETYKKAEAGQRTEIIEHNGLLGMKWYYLD